MNERRIKKPARDGNVPFQPVLGVEHSDVKFFDRQIFEPLGEYLEHVARPSNGRAFLAFLRGHAPSQLESGVDTNSTSRSYATHGGEGGNRPGGQNSQRSAAGREYFLADTERGSALGSAA